MRRCPIVQHLYLRTNGLVTELLVVVEDLRNGGNARIFRDGDVLAVLLLPEVQNTTNEGANQSNAYKTRRKYEVTPISA